MGLTEELMQLEHRLATGGGAEYDEILADDALVIVPGAVLDKTACVAAMESSPGWDRVELAAPQRIDLPDAAIVVYAFSGWRGDTTYRAALSSTYAKGGKGWQLVLHQQTPES